MDRGELITFITPISVPQQGRDQDGMDCVRVGWMTLLCIAFTHRKFHCVINGSLVSSYQIVALIISRFLSGVK
jgi:hypothetical protein